MIKVIITNNNDVLYKSLYNIFLQNELNIEIQKVPQSSLNKLLSTFKRKETIIILESDYSSTFCINILKNVIIQDNIRKMNIIILVIDSNSTFNIRKNKKLPFLNLNTINASLIDIIDLVSNSLKNSINIEKTIDDVFWRLGFTNYFKGSIYLKDAILLAYSEKKLLLDTNILVKMVSEKNNVKNQKIVRSAMDKSLNSMLNFIDTEILYNIFGEDYDGRKISLKYFIDLCIRYLENKKRYGLENKKRNYSHK